MMDFAGELQPIYFCHRLSKCIYSPQRNDRDREQKKSLVHNAQICEKIATVPLPPLCRLRTYSSATEVRRPKLHYANVAVDHITSAPSQIARMELTQVGNTLYSHLGRWSVR
jgi:hypothetical protein